MDSLKDKIKEIEREEIINALKSCRWIMARAARKLGITERMIGCKVRKYGIMKESGRKAIPDVSREAPHMEETHKEK